MYYSDILINSMSFLNAIHLSKKTIRIVKENIIFAIGVKKSFYS